MHMYACALWPLHLTINYFPLLFLFVLYFVIIDNHLIVSVCCGSNCYWVWLQMSTVTVDWNQLERLWNESGVRVQLIYTIKDHRQPSSA